MSRGMNDVTFWCTQVKTLQFELKYKVFETCTCTIIDWQMLDHTLIIRENTGMHIATYNIMAPTPTGKPGQFQGILHKLLEKLGNFRRFYFCPWIWIQLYLKNRRKILEKSGKFVSQVMWEPWQYCGVNIDKSFITYSHSL